MAIASLVLGIISLIFAVFGFGLQWLGLLLGIIGIVLGILGKANPAKAGLANAGLVCSIIGTILSGILFLSCVVCASALAFI